MSRKLFCMFVTLRILGVHVIVTEIEMSFFLKEKFYINCIYKDQLSACQNNTSHTLNTRNYCCFLSSKSCVGLLRRAQQ